MMKWLIFEIVLLSSCIAIGLFAETLDGKLSLAMKVPRFNDDLRIVQQLRKLEREGVGMKPDDFNE